MSWIKRNLYFLVGGVIAVVLLGVAGFYFYSKWSLNNESLEKLEAAYADWERISNLNPNPGNDKVDNIRLAREQRVQVLGVVANVQKFFAPIPPIPNSTNVAKEDFASSLRRTVDQLQKDAASGGVALPPRYDFSFQAERNLPNFAPGSLNPLSTQLGDVRTICNILFKAKINALDAVRRERISADDQNGPQTDYLDPSNISVTNDLAVLVPYEVAFQCFSAELAATLSGFAADEHGIIVKSVNVEPFTGSTMLGLGDQTPAPYGNALYGGGYPNPAAMYANPELRAGLTPSPTVPAARGGLQTALDEKSLKVTLVLNVVRLLPKK